MIRSNKFRGLAVLSAVLVIAVMLYAAAFRPAVAPQVLFKTLAGEKIRTADLRGKVVLVEFWATSCVTCVQEMPRVIQTYEKYRGQGFEIMAVAMQYDPPDHVLTYATRNKLPFRVALDIDGEVAGKFGNVRLTPTSFLIDRQGRIVKQYLGAPDPVQFHALLERHIREPA